MLDKLERKFGRYAIKNLMKYIIVLYAIGFFLSMVMPEVYYVYFSLDAERILHGEVWRIVTFLMNSPNSNPIFVIFSLYFYYLLGNTLERVWGAFRFNLYYLTGVLGTVLAAIIVYLVSGLSGPLMFYMDTYYINMSLFLAFATIIPDMQVLFMFIIPVKMKWLAYLDVFFLLLSFVKGGWATRVAIIVALVNFLFYFISFMRRRVSPKQMYRKYTYNKAVNRGNTGSSGGAGKYPNGAHHRCAVCGRTELDDETLEFRFCSRCNGNYEYCQDHLFTHTHVQ